MKTNEYVWHFCVLQFLIVVDVNVNALSLTSCENPIEYEVCQLTCATPDISKNVAFYKLPDTGTIIAQCIPSIACLGTGQYNISQPSSSSTVLSFNHSRQEAGDWRCVYETSDVSVSVTWATYPQAVSTTLASNTIDTSIDVNVTLECLHSQSSPTVTLQYEDENGNIHATSEGPFQCVDTAVVCTDSEFKTYSCSVTIKAESGMDNSDVYSIQVKTKVANVQTEDIQTIATGISFQRSGGTSTSTDNNGKALVILFVCLLVAYFIVVAVRFCAGSTKNTSGNCFLTFCQFIEERFFDCCGCESSQESEDDLGFFKDKVCTLNSLLGFTYLVLYGVIVEVIVLLAVYYGSDKFQEGLVIGVGFLIVLGLSFLCLLVVVRMLMKFVNNGASRSPWVKSQKNATFDKRQQPDGDEGHQSTPKDPYVRHLTTGRPLPPKPDIASPQTGSFDSVNSPRPIVLVPIENPNILPSIDTLDEQKTDTKPKDKKKKKKKKDEGQDNPAYVQDNNVLT